MITSVEDRRPNAVENRLTRARFHAEELVERVDFGPDLFLGLDRQILDVLHKAFHHDSLVTNPPRRGDRRVDFPDYAAAGAVSLAPALARTVNTGHGAFRSTRSATLPITA